MIGKKLAIIVLAGAILSMAMAPDVLACRCRHHRAYYGYRRTVATRTYYYAPQRRVAGVTYYEPYHHHSKLKAALTILAPAALGAGVGALAGGGKGAGIGALIGGGGGAAYYLIKHRHHGYYD
jgi:hypothetical protein